MAIPVQQGSYIEQTKAPKVAKGQTIDLTNQIAQSYNNMISSIKNIGDIAIALKRNSEMNKMTEAETLYRQQLQDLNTEMQEKQGIQREAFEEEYVRRANEYHNQYLGSINKIEDAKIREDSRARINNVNLQNRQTSDLFFFRARVEHETDSFNNKNNLDLENIKNMLTGDANQDKEIMNNFIKQKADEFIDFGVSHGATPEAIQANINNYSANIVKSAADEMAATQDFGTGGFQAYKPVLDLIKESYDSGKITGSAYREIARPHELKAVSLEVKMRRTDAFLNKKGLTQVLNSNGDINEKFLNEVKPFTPNLSPEERYNYIKSLTTENGDGLSQDDIAERTRIMGALYTNNITNVLRNDGINDWDILDDAKGLLTFKLDEEKLDEKIKTGKFTTEAFLNMVTEFEKALSKDVPLPNGKVIHSVATAEQMNEWNHFINKINNVFVKYGQDTSSAVGRKIMHDAHAKTYDVFNFVAMKHVSAPYKEPRTFMGIKFGDRPTSIQHVGRILDIQRQSYFELDETERRGDFDNLTMAKKQSVAKKMAEQLVFAEYGDRLGDIKDPTEREAVKQAFIDEVYKDLWGTIEQRERAIRMDNVRRSRPIGYQTTSGLAFLQMINQEINERNGAM